jgi:hypothetical protein
MSLPLPDLDDRTFDDLIAAARRQIAQTTQSQWTDFSPGDPGMVLLELYAYLTETMIYRLNRLPQKVYVALLNLLGAKLRPPSAANVTLQFTLDRAAAQPVTIPRGTRVASSRVDANGQPVVFRTHQQVIIPPGQTQAHVLAYHCEQVEGELLGISTGMPGSTFKVAAPPILDAPGEFENALIVGVEASPHQLPAAMPAREFNGKTYQLWRQTDSFTALLSYPYVYRADRMAGTICFAPGQGRENNLPPAVLPPGRDIRVWYWYSKSPEPVDPNAPAALTYGEVNGELLGQGTGQPGQAFQLTVMPVIEQTLRLAVQTAPGEVVEADRRREFDGKAYREWRPVDDLSQIHASPYVYRLDSSRGIVTFASTRDLEQACAQAELRRAHIPPAGQVIRAWYWRGGGSAGNVPAGSLTTLMDPVDGVRLSVTNPGPASGGYAAETVEQALLRGPQELYSLPRGAITARDFERLALRSSPAVARAHAFAQVELWKRARPGTVEVLLVPDLPEIPKEQRGSGHVTPQVLRRQETQDALDDCRTSLNALRPLGTDCLVNWASYKTVRVQARVFVSGEENAVAVRDRVLRRLHEHINPLPTAASPGWPFGKPLQSSDVYNIALAEPGVRWMDRVGLVMDEVPEKNVCTLAADYFEPGTWYAGSSSTLFRSRNDGDGWEPAGNFPEEEIRLIRPHPRQPGLLIALTRLKNSAGLRLHLSCNYGETWKEDIVFTLRFDNQDEMNDVTDLVWSLGDTLAVLLASDRGLYEFNLQRPGETAQLVDLHAASDRQLSRRPVYAIATVRTAYAATELIWLAAATQDGVFFSNDGGQTFHRYAAGLSGNEDIQKLAFQVAGGTYLWAGTAAVGGQKGQGCLRLRMGMGADHPWETFGPDQGWEGGSCNQLAFVGSRVLAATHHGGVLNLDSSGAGGGRWEVPDVAACDLPPRSEPGPFQPVAALATNWNPDSPPEQPVIMAGVVRELERQEGEGIYRSVNLGRQYEFLSRRVHTERVTLPATWLFVSGKHEVIVAYEGQEGL